MEREFKIGEFRISADSDQVFVIAEIGNNHNGSMERAVKLIDLAKESGADCVKFQMRDFESLYRKKTLAKSGDDLAAEYTIDLLERFELTPDEHHQIADYCRKNDISYMCTPWEPTSAKRLLEFGVPAFKVASADLTNLPLIDTLAQSNLPLILSTGMSSEEEIKAVIHHLNGQNAMFALLHCNSTYPAPFHGINLRFIERLKALHPFVGYSGHERGIAVTLGAVSLGARIVERHFTLDRNMEGPDHAASLEPKEFSQLVTGIRELEEALGQGGKKQVSQGEMINRENLGKSLVASRSIRRGTTLTKKDILVRSPGQGLSPLHFGDLVGKTIERDIEEEGYFFKSDLVGVETKARDYRFKRPWGIPIRYHDFQEFSQVIKPDLFEFHLSYNDMDLKIGDYIDKTYDDLDFVVHAPELFKGSHLMDLATEDKEYRDFSLSETQRVINITRELKNFFPKTAKPLIVANIGGISRDKNISKTEKEKAYTRFKKSLDELDLDGVELIPQTMAPFPWHFGGQRFQNLFVMPEETADYCERFSLRMCLDVSHSKLTCNHFGLDFERFCSIVGPYTAHLHLGDSKGVDGEGLQVGDGEIDFHKLADIFTNTCPSASFIPEIWQGHKNQGEGFWIALERLEGIF